MAPDFVDRPALGRLRSTNNPGGSLPEKIRAAVVFGTRPEAIKLAPVIAQMRRRPERFDVFVAVTAQHREMLDQVLALFGIVPDADLDIMRANQTLDGIVARAIEGLGSTFDAARPDLVLVQGDTTTTFVGALAAFHRRIPVGHVEAGLRTHDRYSPFPEEINRQLTSRLASLHFAPTPRSAAALLSEGIPAETIHITGNTVIDALLDVAARPFSFDDPMLADLPERTVLITAHRRESFGAPFQAMGRAIASLADRYPDAAFVYPVHLNPNVREPVNAILGGHANVRLIEPLDYAPFVHLMKRAHIILTDSGGVQEEAPSLGKPVLVMREKTERPEGIEAGTVRLVGTNEADIVEAVTTLMDDDDAWRAMAMAKNPYGDGHSAERIVDICDKTFGT
ncbi:UDP-N-acetylglucosamine 2-epimerase (non-hydrolyzing) [bacterium]|nr:UDP-N-acetylglucosamine 2-epimerase (non-hydrolyzing) [bacterium]